MKKQAKPVITNPVVVNVPGFPTDLAETLRLLAKSVSDNAYACRTIAEKLCLETRVTISHCEFDVANTGSVIQVNSRPDRTAAEVKHSNIRGNWEPVE